MSAKGLTFDFASALAAWPGDEEAVTRACMNLLIDGLGVVSAGAVEEGPRLLAQLARNEGSRPVASVVGMGFATSAAQAARINGVSMHVLDFEPMWNPPNHVLSTILSALLALAEQREGEGKPPQGRELLRALAKGVEAQGRLRVASKQYEPAKLLFHPPGVVGPIASAAACATLLGLGVEQMAMAMSIAASRASGIMANIGSMTKALHCGDAAMRGLEAALLAQSGFTADPDALGSPRGYGRAYYGEAFDPSGLAVPVDTPRVLDPGMAWKLFPSQYGTHFAITAALDCRAEIDDPAKVRSVRVTTPVMAYVDRPAPVSGLDGKFSFQYGVAAALLDARVDVATFTNQRCAAADMSAMLGKIELKQDAAIAGTLDHMHVDVEVVLDDGRTVHHRCNAPEGSWSRPVGAERVRAKAASLLSTTLEKDQSDRFWELVGADIGTLRIAPIMQLLQAPAAAGAR